MEFLGVNIAKGREYEQTKKKKKSTSKITSNFEMKNICINSCECCYLLGVRKVLKIKLKYLIKFLFLLLVMVYETFVLRGI